MTTPAIITFNIPAFRIAFPAFADETKYPDVTLQLYWDSSTCFISNRNYGWLNGDCRTYALNLMTAHMTQISTLASTGQANGVVTGAGVGAVNVSVMPPPVKSQFQYWLYMTPYGAQLAALLNVKGVGGISVGGLPEKSAFRKVGGIF